MSTERKGPTVSTLVNHVFANAQRRAGSPAVAFGNDVITYGELAARIGAVAATVSEAAVPPANVIGVPVSRDVDALVRWLAVGALGCTPFAFDQTQPAGRSVAQLANAAACCTLTTAGIEPTTHPGTPSALGPAAYMIATSGSTGEPKIVSVPREALQRYERGLLNRLGDPERLKSLLLYPLCVDIGFTAIVAAFATGGVLHIVDDAAVRNALTVRSYVADQDIDLVKITPSHLHAIQQGDLTAAVPKRFLILGGEPLSRPFAHGLAGTNPGCQVFNHYGPTETAIGVSMRRVDAAPASTGSVDLGEPLCGVSLTIGGGHELLIRLGETALGYAGNPRQTAERFVPDAAADAAPGARLFRSGDVVDVDDAGAPVFVARLDDQVKIRGTRIELGDLDAALRSIDGVADAASAIAGEPQYLAAAVVASRPLDRTEVIGALRHLLPEPMVPKVVVFVSAVPLGPSGKIDRAAVAQWAVQSEADGADLSEPGGRDASSTELTRRVRDQLADVLQLDELSVDADFYENGGDSLLAMTAVWQIRLELGIIAEVADLVEGRSAAGLMRVLELDT